MSITESQPIEVNSVCVAKAEDPSSRGMSCCELKKKLFLKHPVCGMHADEYLELSKAFDEVFFL